MLNVFEVLNGLPVIEIAHRGREHMNQEEFIPKINKIALENGAYDTLFLVFGYEPSHLQLSGSGVCL